MLTADAAPFKISLNSRYLNSHIKLPSEILSLEVSLRAFPLIHSVSCLSVVLNLSQDVLVVRRVKIRSPGIKKLTAAEVTTMSEVAEVGLESLIRAKCCDGRVPRDHGKKDMSQSFTKAGGEYVLSAFNNHIYTIFQLSSSGLLLSAI